MYKRSDIIEYIRNNDIISKIFAIDNHPEVISKGKDIYEFICKEDILQET